MPKSRSTALPRYRQKPSLGIYNNKIKVEKEQTQQTKPPKFHIDQTNKHSVLDFGHNYVIYYVE